MKKAYKNLYGMGAFEPSAIQRRKVMKNLAEGNFTQDDITLSYDLQETYGELGQLNRDSNGMKITAEYNGEQRIYFVPSEVAWANGKGIRTEKAYRVFGENNKTMEVKEVQNFSELEAITKAVYDEIRKKLRK